MTQITTIGETQAKLRAIEALPPIKTPGEGVARMKELSAIISAERGSIKQLLNNLRRV